MSTLTKFEFFDGVLTAGELDSDKCTLSVSAYS